MIDRRAFLIRTGAGVLAAAAPAAAASGVPATTHNAATALDELMAGNARFVADKAICPPLTARRLELEEGQSPFAIVLSCSDSRVPVETIFDQIPGNIFGVRIAGNFAERGGVGSIEYAIAVLKAPLILVLGHSDCGAVKAALANVDSGASQPGSIQYLVTEIAPALKRGESLAAAVESNVHAAMRQIARSTIVADAISAGHAAIAGGVYDLHSGRVTLVKKG